MDPYRYQNARDLLRAALDAQGWTQRDLARKVGWSESGLSFLLSGRRRLRADRAARLADALGFQGDVRSWFLALVDLGGSARERAAAEATLRAMLAARHAPSPDDAVLAAQADLRVPVLQELATCEGFRPEPAWVARMFDPEIAPEAAAELWDRLLALGLVRARPGGGFDTVSVRTGPAVPLSQTLSSRAQHEDALRLATESLTRFQSRERRNATVTMALSEATAERMRARLVEMERELVAMAEEDPDPRLRVYVLAWHWFPVTSYADWEPSEG